MSASRATSSILVGFALCSLLACRPAASPHRAVHWRWIETERTELFDLSNHKIEEEVFRVDLGDATVPAGWRVESPRSGLELTGEVKLDAANLQEITVRLKQSPGTTLKLQLAWAGPGEAWDSKRSLFVTDLNPRKQKLSVRRFAVADHPLWRGPIDRIRLRAKAGAEIELHGIAGVSTRVKADALPDVVARPWKIELADDVRNGFVTAPGLALRRTCAVPRGGIFRASFAHLGISPSAVHFRVAVADRGVEEVVFRHTLTPEDLPVTSWRPLQVDLDSWAGREVELVLTTTADSQGGELRGLPVWANPEIVTPAASPPKANVILISIDTLRADRLSLYGHDRPTTPNLTAWAERQGVVFRNAVAQASWTLPSHTSMLTGVGAFRHGVNFDRPVPDSLKLLSEYLREDGYRTLAVTGGGWVHPQYQLGQGFDRFWYWSDVDPTTGQIVDGAEHELDWVLERATSWIREHAAEPFLLFLHTYDIHYRLVPREPFYSRYSDVAEHPTLGWRRAVPRADDGFKSITYPVVRTRDGERQLPQELAAVLPAIYDSRIAHLDSRLPALFDELAALGLSDRTIVVFTSDHGELLGEHDLYAHLCLYDENLMVPLIVAAPGTAEAGLVVDTQVRSIDIVPTILDLLDIPPTPEVEGRTLRPLLQASEDDTARPASSYAASTNFGMSLRLDNRLKLIFNNTPWAPVNGDTELYHIDVDPGESQPVIDPKATDRMRRQLVESYLNDVSGVRMIVRNPGNEPFGLTVEGPVNLRNIKSVDAAGDLVHWRDGGRLDMLVPAATSVTLIFEHGHARKPLVVTAGDGGTRSRTVIDLSTGLDEPFTLVWRGTRWDRSEIDPAGGSPSIFMQQTVGISDSGIEQSTIPDELEERLRALGYLE